MAIQIGFLMTFDVTAFCKECNESFTQKVYPNEPDGYTLHGTTCECGAGFMYSESDREKLAAFRKEYFDFYGDDPEETDEEKEFNKKFDAYEAEKAVYKQAFIDDGMHPVEADMIADELAMYLLK